MTAVKNPKTWTVPVELPDGVSAAATYTRDRNSVRLTRLTFTGANIRATDLHALSFKQAKAEAEWVLLAARRDTRARPLSGRPDGTDEWWETFALTYTQHRVQGISHQAITDALGRQIGEPDLPPSTVDRWAHEARRRGLLPSTNRTRKDVR